MITIAHGAPYTFWVPVETAATVYVGSIICLDTSNIAASEGFVIREQADGTDNKSNYDVPFGVVIGTNEASPLFNTTYKCEYTTQQGATDPHDGSTREYVGVEGPWSKSEGTAMVKVALITPSTILKAPIYNNAVGTAPALLTCTAADTDGKQATTNATTIAPVAGMNTIYCRTGANAGCYRVTDNTSTTIHEWDVYMPKDVAVGDTFVTVPVRVGLSYVRLGDDTVCSYINSSETAATNYDIIYVTRLDLREAGKEFAEFFFASEVFTAAALR